MQDFSIMSDRERSSPTLIESGLKNLIGGRDSNYPLISGINGKYLRSLCFHQTNNMSILFTWSSIVVIVFFVVFIHWISFDFRFQFPKEYKFKWASISRKGYHFNVKRDAAAELFSSSEKIIIQQHSLNGFHLFLVRSIHVCIIDKHRKNERSKEKKMCDYLWSGQKANR